DSHEQLSVSLHLVPGREVDDAVPGRSPGPEVEDSIGLALVVLVAAGIGAGDRDEVEIRGDFPSDLRIREGFEHVLRDQWNPVPMLNLDAAIHAWSPSQRGIICAVAGTGHSFRALIGSPQKGIVRAKCEAINPAAQVNFNSLAQSLAEVLEISVACHVRRDKQ